MTAIGLASASGAPGVTTSAILLAAVWQGAVLLEANPAGGDLRYWYRDIHDAPLRADLGVVSLLTSPAPLHPPTLLAHLQQLPGGLPVLIGPGSPAQVEVLREQWWRLASLLDDARQANRTHDADGQAAAKTSDLVLDAGVLAGPSWMSLSGPLLQACDVALLVCRATASSLGHTRDLHRLLQQTLGLSCELLLIGPAEARADAARAVDLPATAVHLLPDAPKQAAAVTSPWTRRLDRSPLLTGARALADTLHARFNLQPPRAYPQTDAPPASFIDLREEVAPS